MRHTRAVLAILALATTPLGACASMGGMITSPDSRLRDIAASDTGSPAGSVQVSNVHRGAFQVSWEASTPNGDYACSGDDMLHSHSCAKK